MSPRRAAGWAVTGLVGAAGLETAVSAIHSNLGWIRVLDFPRLAMLVIIGALLPGCALLPPARRWGALAVLLAAGAFQGWRVRPYTPLVAPEMALERAGARDDACFTAVGLNVFQYNRQYGRTLAMLRRERPDLVLLMETDARWATALAPLLAEFPYTARRALDNTYGMVFASRLPVVAARFTEPTGAGTPTFYARIRTRAGQAFDYVGLHPRPPLPGQDTDARDASIARADHRLAGDPGAALAMGDFNDAAWSTTTQRFKAAGGYRDPRVGRGPYATFPAGFVALGWPLDQIFATPAFTVQSVRVLEDVGSDHRPLAVRLCLPAPAGPANPTSPEALSPAKTRAAPAGPP